MHMSLDTAGQVRLASGVTHPMMQAQVTDKTVTTATSKLEYKY